MASNTLTVRLKQHLNALAGDRYPFSPQHKLAAVEEYIAAQFMEAGLGVQRHSFTFQKENFSNIIADLKGQSPSVFIIAAHFDAVQGTPGADDNASGVAVLLETARLLAVENPARSIRFVAFNLEEFGMVGSLRYVEELKRNREPVLGMISLEMVGYTDKTPGSQQYPPGFPARYSRTGDFLALVANGKSKKLMENFNKQMNKIPGLKTETLVTPFNGRLLAATRLSDHAPFWDAGYPALLVTDTSFFRNPHYHLASDTLETLDLEFMSRVTEGAASAVRSLVSQ